MELPFRLLVLIMIYILLNAPAATFAQDSFYQGKTVRIIVGTSAGGGFDTYTRTLARHFGKHIPGQPAVIVENMPGAGHLIAANHMYNVAKPDGLTVIFMEAGFSISFSSAQDSNLTLPNTNFSDHRSGKPAPVPSRTQAASPA
jgi:tripartite-type tricarboxylate transporter receptor subunit TctC